MPRGRAALHAPGVYRAPPDATVVPLTFANGAPTTPIVVDGETLTVMVDTGSSGPLALSTTAAQAAGLLAPGRGMRAAHSVSLGGLGLDRVVDARMVELAGLRFARTPVQIYAPSAGPSPPGLLGMGLLKRFRFALDLPGRSLMLLRPTPLLVPEQSRDRGISAPQIGRRRP